MEELNLFPDKLKNQSHFLFLNFGEDSAKLCFDKLMEIRNREIPCEFYPNPTKIKKQMNYANERSIPFVILIGPEEIKKDVFVVKDMNSGNQSEHSISSLVSTLEELFQSL